MKEFIEKLIDEKQEKLKVTSLEIIVTGTNDKPYFEIKYKEIGKEYYNIGYSSYYLNKVFAWKEKYFEIVNKLAEEHKVGWIPCSERMPKSGTSVIVSYKDRFLTQADGTCEGWYDETNMIWHLTDYEYSDNVEVIAWRERLKPYQPKGEQ